MAAEKKTKPAVRKDSIGEQIISAGGTKTTEDGRRTRGETPLQRDFFGFDWICFGFAPHQMYGTRNLFGAGCRPYGTPKLGLIGFVSALYRYCIGFDWL